MRGKNVEITEKRLSDNKRSSEVSHRSEFSQAWSATKFDRMHADHLTQDVLGFRVFVIQNHRSHFPSRLKLQSHFGDKPVNFKVVNPLNRTAVLNSNERILPLIVSPVRRKYVTRHVKQPKTGAVKHIYARRRHFPPS